MTSKSGNREAMQPQPTGASAKDSQAAQLAGTWMFSGEKKNAEEIFPRVNVWEMLWPLTSTLTWALSLIFFSFSFLSFSGWTTFCCIVCDGSWLLWNTQETLPSSGAASFRQNPRCFLHALFPPGSSVRFTWSGWNTGQPSLWVTSLSRHVRIHWVSTQNTSLK